jgi:hypothetical protein
MSELRGLHLHVDCASGAAGDMMLGALFDLGVPVDVIGAALDAIGATRQRLQVTKLVKSGIAATDVKVDTSGELPGIGRHEHRDPSRSPAHLDSVYADELVEVTEIRDAPVRRPSARNRCGSDLVKLVERTTVRTAGAPSNTIARPRDEPEPSQRRARRPGSNRTSTRARSITVMIDRSDHARPGHHAHYHYADPSADRPRRSPRTRALDIFDRIARAERSCTAPRSTTSRFTRWARSIRSSTSSARRGARQLSPAAVTCGGDDRHDPAGARVLPVPAPPRSDLRDAGGVMADGAWRASCTPTGTAILTSAMRAGRLRRRAPGERGLGPAMPIQTIARACSDHRARATAVVADPGAIWQLDANLDDMGRAVAPAAMRFAAGALTCGGRKSREEGPTGVHVSAATRTA